ncbi:MAG: ABC transporter permease subunit [Erysipelotrichaceae bacterium]|nr:ABC transporter permease subunit [Erysipelotrichaceae bacterium]
MIKLLIAEWHKFRCRRFWRFLTVILIIVMLYWADGYFKLYPNVNPTNIELYRQMRINTQMIYENQINLIQEFENKETLSESETAQLSLYRTSAENNKAIYLEYLSLERALASQKWLKANQILQQIESRNNNNDTANELIRQYLIDNNLPTVLLSTISTGTIAGYLNYLVYEKIWLVFSVIGLLCGFDLINDERRTGSLKTTFTQPYKRSHIFVAKISIRIIAAVIIILSTLITTIGILAFNHSLALFHIPVLYSPLTLSGFQAVFSTVDVMPFLRFFTLNLLHGILNCCFIIALCGFCCLFVRSSTLNFSVLLITLLTVRIGFVQKSLPAIFSQTPLFYLFHDVLYYQTNDYQAIYYTYRDVSYHYGLLILLISSVGLTAAGAFLIKRKDNFI